MDTQVLLGLVLLGMQAALATVLLSELCTNRAAAGIAVLSELFWFVAGLGWAWYGAWTGGTIIGFSGALAAACCAAVCLLVRHGVTRPNWQRYAILAATFSCVMIVSGVVFGVTGLSVFLAVFGFVQFIPQLRLSLSQLLRGVVVSGATVRGPAFRAVYTGTWCVYAVAWGLFGDARIDWPCAVWGATGCVAFALQALVGVRSNTILNREAH